MIYEVIKKYGNIASSWNVGSYKYFVYRLKIHKNKLGVLEPFRNSFEWVLNCKTIKLRDGFGLSV